MEIAVVDLDGFVPVGHGRRRGETVAGGLGRKLPEGFSCTGNGQAEGLPGIIEKVVPGSPVHGGVVIGPKGTDARPVALIVPGHMVRDKVHDHLQSVVMGPLHQPLELFHPAVRIICQIGIYVIVIRDGIGRSGIPFDNLGMGRRASPVGFPGSVPDESGVPYIINAKSPEILQGLGIDR